MNSFTAEVALRHHEAEEISVVLRAGGICYDELAIVRCSRTMLLIVIQGGSH
jgi:hypothetical protein